MIVYQLVSISAGQLLSLGSYPAGAVRDGLWAEALVSAADYDVGVFVLLVGLALLSVATYRAAILPHWSAYYLVAALAVIVFGEIGVFLVGLVWIALGYVLWSQRDATARQHPRLRRTSG